MGKRSRKTKFVAAGICVLLGIGGIAGNVSAGILSIQGEVHDLDGSALPGDGLKGEALDGCIQCIYAGPDGRSAPPTPEGNTTEDDVLLETAEYPGQFQTAVGEGFPFSQEGRFFEDFKHTLPPDSKIYCRAWNGSLPQESTHYGDSALVSLTDTEFSTLVLKPWKTNKRVSKGSGTKKNAQP